MTQDTSGGRPTVQCTIDVDAPAERVWQLVSDLPGMGALSPENRGGRWVKGDGPGLGSVFVGRNGAGRRRWSTRSTVVRCEPGRCFAFDVVSGGLPVSHWAYHLEPTTTGCRVTESWEDRRGSVVRVLGRVMTGVGDRTTFTAGSIERTLQNLKAAAERSHVL